MGKQYTLFDLGEIKPTPCCGNCEYYYWVKYYGGRHQECSRMLNKKNRPLRPKASQAACMCYDLKKNL